jgi:hypothetical protein
MRAYTPSLRGGRTAILLRPESEIKALSQKRRSTCDPCYVRDVADERTRALSRLRGTEAAKAIAKDESKARIQKLASMVGNEEIAKRIESGNATRDQMLAFVTERLQVGKEMQQRELELTRKSAHWDWWRRAADSMRVDQQEPEPKRWGSVAHVYEAAVQAICSGDLRRGQALLEEAYSLDQKITDETTKLVDTREIERAGAVDPGTFAAMVAQTPTSGACAVPTNLKSLIDAMINIEQTVPEMPNRRRRRDPWWTLEDEEEEEKPDGEGG